jgi:hypothetical protein
MTFGVKISGGLGNQLFQLCFAYSLYLSSSEKTFLDIDEYQTNKSTRLSPLLLLPSDSCGIGTFVKRRLSLPFLDSKQVLTEKVLSSKTPAVKADQKLTIVNENYRQFVPGFLELKQAYFTGTFSSYKYWHSGFNSTIEWVTNNISRLPIDDGNFSSYDLSVHARRGDYISNPKTRFFHGYCDTTYFDKAFRFIKYHDSSIDSVLVSSDDSIFASELRTIAAKYFGEVHILEEDSALEALLQLSKCKSFIGSNSTFSWWAGYLSPKDIRIFPSDWYLSKKMNFSQELFFPYKPVLIDDALVQ